MTDKELVPKEVNLISVPVAWAIYEVSGNLRPLNGKGGEATPPHVVMEALVLAGKAKRVAFIQSVGDGSEVEGEVYGGEDGEEHPGTGGGLWFDSEE